MTCELLFGDCDVVLPTLLAESVDAIITSPRNDWAMTVSASKTMPHFLNWRDDV